MKVTESRSSPPRAVSFCWTNLLEREYTVVEAEADEEDMMMATSDIRRMMLQQRFLYPSRDFLHWLYLWFTVSYLD